MYLKKSFIIIIMQSGFAPLISTMTDTFKQIGKRAALRVLSEYTDPRDITPMTESEILSDVHIKHTKKTQL